MSNIYSTRTREVFKWPRQMPLSEKPSQPPTRTGIRLFCPDQDTRICKDAEIYQDYRQSSNRSKKIEKKDHGVLMSRDKYIRLNKHFKIKRYVDNHYKMRSTYQVGYADNKLNYDHLIDRARKMSEDQPRQICAMQNGYIDPIKFKKINNQQPLIS